jgi:uncharacterized protein (DUF58 family)
VVPQYRTALAFASARIASHVAVGTKFFHLYQRSRSILPASQDCAHPQLLLRHVDEWDEDGETSPRDAKAEIMGTGRSPVVFRTPKIQMILLSVDAKTSRTLSRLICSRIAPTVREQVEQHHDIGKDLAVTIHNARFP